MKIIIVLQWLPKTTMLCAAELVSERTAVDERIAYAAAVAEEKGRSAQHNEV